MATLTVFMKDLSVPREIKDVEYEDVVAFMGEGIEKMAKWSDDDSRSSDSVWSALGKSFYGRGVKDGYGNIVQVVLDFSEVTGWTTTQ